MAKPQTRRHCVTSKIATPFGTMYSHTEVSSAGKVIGARFSAPGKFNDTEIMELLELLGNTITADVQHVGGYE